MMGWWFPGRPLVVAFPALVVLVGVGAARLPRIAVALAAWSLAIAVGLVWSARTGAVYLAVNPFDLGFPLPPRWAYPDFRHFTAREVLLSMVWALALAALWVSSRRREAARVARRGGARPAGSGARTGREGNPEGQDPGGREPSPTASSAPGP